MWIPLEGVTTVEENKKKREVKVRGDIHLFVVRAACMLRGYQC